MFSVLVLLLLTIRKNMIGNLTKLDRVNWLHLREVFFMFECFYDLHWRAAHISLDAINFFLILGPAFVYQNKTGSRAQIECTVQMI